MKAIILQQSGSFETVAWPSDDSLGYNILQKSVGGYIERVASADGSMSFWVNEEGKLNGFTRNMLGTLLWWLTAPYAAGQDILVGPVVITGGAGPEGQTLGLTDEQVAFLTFPLEMNAEGSEQ
jgi:Domain of unknown function (DUF3846)